MNNQYSTRFTENIFQLQKSKIEEIKKREWTIESNWFKDDLIIQSKKIISFNDVESTKDHENSWIFTSLSSQVINDEECPIIFPMKWREPTCQKSVKGWEIQGNIYNYNDIINYDISTVQVTTTFTLKGDSSFWWFLRSEKEMDEYSAVIKISKIEETQKWFISFGTYVQDWNNNLIFKIFASQQLVDRSKVKSINYIEHDICLVKMTVYDSGEDKVYCKVFFNDSTEENKITSDFFLPIAKKSSLMFGAIGDKVILTKFRCSCNTKDRLNLEHQWTAFILEENNCKCCNIF